MYLFILSLQVWMCEWMYCFCWCCIFICLYFIILMGVGVSPFSFFLCTICVVHICVFLVFVLLLDPFGEGNVAFYATPNPFLYTIYMNKTCWNQQNSFILTIFHFFYKTIDFKQFGFKLPGEGWSQAKNQ